MVSYSHRRMPIRWKKNIKIFSNNFIDDQEMPLSSFNFMACAYAELFWETQKMNEQAHYIF